MKKGKKVYEIDKYKENKEAIIKADRENLRLVYADVELAITNAADIRRKMGCAIALVYREYGMPFTDNKALSEKTIIRQSREFSFRRLSEILDKNSPNVIRIWM